MSEKKVLKTDHESHEIRPFLLNSVNLSPEGSPSFSGEDEESEKRIKGEEEAYKRGFLDGVNAGRSEILRDIENQLRLLGSLMEGIESLRKEIYEKMEREVVDLSLAIAGKVIHEAADHCRETVVATAREAIRKASDREMLKIKINPVDYETLSKRRLELLRCVDGVKSILFEEDESVRPGGCLIETNQGDIDARLDSQIRVIEGEMRRQK